MRILIIILFLLLVPIAFAIPECQREQDISKIPCNIISTWNVSNCGDYNITVYNTSENQIGSIQWETYTPVCNAVFNISAPGTYHYVSYIEDGVITIKEEAEMIAAILILIPVLLGLFCLIGSFTLSDQHSPLKIFLFLLSFVSFFVSLHFGMISVVKFMDFPELQELIGSTIYWFSILFVMIVTYFMIYMFYQFIRSAAKAKQEKIEY